METLKFNFANNFRTKAEIKDLEELGWSFDSDYASIAEAQGITEEEAKEWENENYHVVIQVDEEGKTEWYFQNTMKDQQGISETSDKESTGDDEQTIKDLNQLYSEDKLWDMENDWM
jgi:hypothetical protein